MSYIPSNSFINNFNNSDVDDIDEDIKDIKFTNKKKDRSSSFCVNKKYNPLFAPILKKKISLRRVSPLKLSIPKEEEENEDELKIELDKLNLNASNESLETQKDSTESININRCKERSNSVFIPIPVFTGLYFSMKERDLEIQKIMRADSTDDSIILNKLKKKNL